MTSIQDSRKLNVGSGEFPKEGFINIDYYSLAKPDVAHNLNEFPYPFADDYFQVIEADHVLEHLEDPFKVMGEFYRICAPNGILRIRVPHFSRGFTHADHRRGFDVTFPYYFNPNFIGGYQGIPLKLLKLHLNWFAQPYLKKAIMPIPLYYVGIVFGWIIDFFANMSPWLCSRLWCYWVGGFEEIEFIFKPAK